MSLTRFVVKGADNSDLQIAQSAFPATISYADLTPVDGSFPTFSAGPCVYVLNATTGRNVFVSSTGTSSFVLDISSSGGGPGTYTIDIAIETEDTPTSAPVSTTTRTAPYYCSVDDVQDRLVNLSVATGSSGPLDRTILRRMIVNAYGEINGALAVGGYDVPVTNSQKSIFTGALTAADVYVNVDLDSGESTSDYPVGSTVRIIGDSSSTLQDEFTNVVSLSTGTRLVVEFLKNSYDADGTIELLSEGFLYLHNCNSAGAAYKALQALEIKQGQANEKAVQLKNEFDACLGALRSGMVLLDGLTKTGDFIQSWQTANTDDDPGPFFKVDAEIF